MRGGTVGRAGVGQRVGSGVGWSGDSDSEGVRAQLLAQKAIYRMQNRIWRRPVARITAAFNATFSAALKATWGVWRRRLWRG